jgi:hypothetical protein
MLLCLHLRLDLALVGRLRRLCGELGNGAKHWLGGETGELGLWKVWVKKEIQ